MHALEKAIAFHPHLNSLIDADVRKSDAPPSSIRYLYWNGTSGTAPPTSTQFVATHLKRMVTIIGTKDTPVHGVTVRGLGIRDAAATFMEPWGVPSGGDWALHRGGAVFVEGTQIDGKHEDPTGIVLSQAPGSGTAIFHRMKASAFIPSVFPSQSR